MMYDEWCIALAPLRAKLERARDARMGHLGQEPYTSNFNNALAELESAEKAHRADTGCQKRH